MIAMLSGFSTIPSTLPATVVKVTAVLAAAGVAALILRRASAAIRHLVWLLALASTVVLTIAAPAAPRINVPMRALARETFPAAAPAYAPRVPRARPVVVVGSRVVTVGASKMKIIAPAAASKPQTGLTFGGALPFLAIGIWIVGFLLVIARARLGHARVASIVDDARRLISADWRAAIRDASFDVGLRREVEVFESDEITSPMTSGFLNPVVVVPIEARTWDAERRHIVLVHELAHVSRSDYLAQLVATLACAIFWFHPLVWLAATRLRAEAEHAADDHVLKAGTGGVAYASHLLDIARQQSGALPPAVAVGMVKASRLEGRFRAMLDSSRSRANVSSRFQAAAASLTVCAMIPLAGLRPVAPGHRLSPARVVQKYIDMPIALTAPQVAIVASRARRPAMLVSVVDSIFEKTVDATPGDRLTLDLRSGGAIVIHGWDEPRVRVVGRLRGEDWRDTRVSLERVDGGWRLQSVIEPKGEHWSTSHEFELWVPRHTNVQLSSAGGSLAINDVSGDFYGNTGGGGISIQNATGSATLSTGGGEVSVANSRLSGSVTTGGGGVSITNVTGGLRGSSGNGVATAVSGGVTSTARRAGFDGFGGALAISKDGGDILIDRAPEGAILHTGGGRIVVRSSERGVSASTGGGDIELETAYTNNFDRHTNITSDFALENSETDQWDSSNGTPRKYVRATGVAGNGRGLIRVHTVNGDVVLKRVNR